MILAGNQKINYIYSVSGGEKLACDANGSLTYYRSVMVYGSDNKLLYVLTPEGTIFGLLNNKITGDENIELCYWNY